MSTKRSLSAGVPDKGTQSSASKRPLRVSRLQGIGCVGVLKFKPDAESERSANQDTLRKDAATLLPLGTARSAMDRATSLHTSTNPPCDDELAFWSPAPPTQQGQELQFRTRSAFIPNQSIDSPEKSCGSRALFLLAKRQALSPDARNVLPPEHDGYSSDDSDVSCASYIHTPRIYATTPTRSVVTRLPATPLRSAATPLPATPLRSAATPLRSAATPVRSAATPVRSAATPLRSAATPKRSAATPKRSAATPLRSAATPLPATPLRSTATPLRFAATLTRSFGTPIQRTPSTKPPTLSPMQFLSSPSEAALERLIPDFIGEDESDDATSFSWSEAIDICRKVFKCTPKEKQLEVMDHIAQKSDCVLIAPCGWGKTLAFFLPMAYWPSSVTAIVSPLLALMDEQHRKLTSADIPHVVLSSESPVLIDNNLIKRILGGEFRAVFMSPEIIFGDSPTSRLVRKLWQEKAWRDQLRAIVVDEVHCIEKWGHKFRPEYGRLGELRIWAPGVPFVGVSATLTASELAKTKDNLLMPNAHVIRVEDVPDNVRLEIRTQPKDAKLGLSRLLGKDKTIVYFEKISLLMEVFGDLTKHRSDLRGKVGVYFSTLNAKFKNDIMAAFIKNDLQVLLATEAAGMGCDISDVVQVIQYGHPKDLPSFVQRIGRAARDRKIQGFGVLYVPPITQHAADPLVREFTEKRDGTCLWAFIDKLFDFKGRTCNNSCSVCSPQERTTIARCRDTPSKNNAKRWPTRTKEEKYEALQRLKAWREKAYKTWVSSRPFMTSCKSWIMSDETAMQLSEKLSRFRTAEDVKSFASSCGWTPAGGNIWWVGIAEVLCKLNDEIVAGHGPGSETTAASVLAQQEDSSGGDGEGNGEENAPE